MGNANSGRRPTSTAFKVIRGNPGKRHLNADEPKPERAPEDFDTPPAELAGDPVAEQEWSRVVPILRVCGLISTAERSALIVLCQQWSRYVEAHNKVATDGMLVAKSEKGPLIPNPYMSVADKALTHCLRLWTELGMTPSGRSRMSALPQGVNPQPKPSKWAGNL